MSLSSSPERVGPEKNSSPGQYTRSQRGGEDPSSPSTAAHSQERSSRTNSSDTKKAPSPERSTKNLAASNSPMEEHSSSMRSQRWSQIYRSNSSEHSNSAPSVDSAVRKRRSEERRVGKECRQG